MPSEPTRVALSDSLLATGLEGKRLLLPFSKVAPDQLRERLAPHAAEVTRLDLYGLRYPEVAEVPDAEVVLFTSETTVRSAKRNGLIDGIREKGMLVGGIGPGTLGRLEREGLEPVIRPDGTSPASLARAVKRTWANLDPAVVHARRP
jgi:uroporphyrinogen-III synthase